MLWAPHSSLQFVIIFDSLKSEEFKNGAEGGFFYGVRSRALKRKRLGLKRRMRERVAVAIGDRSWRSTLE